MGGGDGTGGAAAGGRPLIVAVDGGASKTDVWVVTADGAIAGTARGEGSNHQFSGLDGAMDALDATIALALRAAGVPDRAGPEADLGVYCLAGMDLPVDRRQLTEAIAGRGWTTRDLVHNDTMAVLRAGVRSGWGVAVVCGSGLNCTGRGPDGSIERFPSLAELSGDFASGGSWLGVRALGLALRAGDGRGRPTLLAERVPAHFNMANAEEVLSAVYTGRLEYGRLFELARVCLEVADGGDAEAGAAVSFLADEVVAMVNAVITRLGVAGREVEVVLGGGLFDSRNRVLDRRVEAGVTALAGRAVFRHLAAPPVLGAALLGLDAAGAPPGAEALLRARADGDDGPRSGGPSPR